MILIVDDQRDIGFVLERLLRLAGQEAVSVIGGVEALAFLAERTPELVVLDLNMPDMDGLDVLRLMKSDEAFKAVPVVMYSAESNCDRIAEAKQLGALDFLCKNGLTFDKLIARIAELATARPRPAAPATSE